MKSIEIRMLAAILLLSAMAVIAPASAQPTGHNASYLSAGPVPIPGRLLVRFRQGVGPQRQKLIAASYGQQVDEIPQLNVKVIQLPANAQARSRILALRQRREVAFAEQEMAYPVQSVTSNDPYYPSQWHLTKISAPGAWATTLGSSTVTIAILDTGVDSAHPDLAPKMVGGWNTYDNNSNTSDIHGHGTTTAGAACAASNNSIGVASPAWGCLLMPMRVTDASGYAFASTLSSALTWAADHGALVASISFEGVATSSTVATAAQYFMNRGGVVTVASGNSGTFMTNADNPNMLVVSGTDSMDRIASFSNTGNNIDLAAPAVSIYTTSRGGGYSAASGTSYSAPIAAGVAALVYSANFSLTANEVAAILKNSADDLGAAGWDTQFGYGRVNAANAVALAVEAPVTSDTTAPTVSFKSPSAGSTVSGTVVVSTAASDNMGVSVVGLYLDGNLIADLETAPYDYVWDSTKVANGTHTLAADAMDAAGNETTSQISISVSNSADTTAPTIAITSPTSGAKVKNNVAVRVNTSDNVGVVKVELYVDNRLVATSTAAPFSTAWSANKASSGTHTLVCKAYDARGNSATSNAVTVIK